MLDYLDWDHVRYPERRSKGYFFFRPKLVYHLVCTYIAYIDTFKSCKDGYRTSYSKQLQDAHL